MEDWQTAEMCWWLSNAEEYRWLYHFSISYLTK